MSKIYSYRWALQVYLNFKTMYRRATEDFMEFSSIEVDTAIKMIMKYQRKWEAFKKCIKILNNWYISGKTVESIYFLTYVKQLGYYKPKKTTGTGSTALTTPEFEL